MDRADAGGIAARMLPWAGGVAAVSLAGEGAGTEARPCTANPSIMQHAES